MQDLKQCGTDTLVSLMEGHEYRYFGISALYKGDEVEGIKILRFAIRVMDVPEEAEVEDYESAILKIVEHLEAGKNVVVHCRGGLGQTGTAAACVLVALVHSAKEVLDTIRETSRGTIQTNEQERFVYLFEETSQQERE